MRVLSLFSGIGGLDLGLERAGMTVVGQVEIDPFCRAVLAKHWPNVKQVADVREVKGDEFGPVDLVCGGVPCQPASCAGKRKGAGDERWLWGEFVRVVRDSGCTWFLAENVRGFLSLADAPGVVRNLEREGFEVRTLLLGAHHVGAPHKRDRIWIVGRLANARVSPVRETPPGRANGTRRAAASGSGQGSSCGRVAHPASGGLGADGIASGRAGHVDQRGEVVADPEQPQRGAGSREQGDEGRAGSGGREPARGVQLADASGTGLEERRNVTSGPWSKLAMFAGSGGTRWPSRPGEPQHEWEAPRLVYAERNARRSGNGEQERGSQGGTVAGGTGGRESQPGLGCPASRLPRRLAGFARRSALKALGNAVVPQVAEVIGTAIMESPHA